MNQRNETPRAATQWIGGSYLTACNGKFPPGRTSTRVLAALQEQPGLTTLELSHQLHLSSHALKHALERLKAAGKIYAEKKNAVSLRRRRPYQLLASLFKGLIMTTFRRITSPKGIPLARGEANRLRILSKLPGFTSDVVAGTNIPASTVLKLLQTLREREQVIGVKQTHPKFKRTEWHWTAIPGAKAKLPPPAQNFLAAIDPTKRPANGVTAAMRKAALEMPESKNVWARPVYHPPTSRPVREGSLAAFALPSRGIKT